MTDKERIAELEAKNKLLEQALIETLNGTAEFFETAILPLLPPEAQGIMKMAIAGMRGQIK